MILDRRDNVPGTIYVLHFDRRYRHAGHYIGWTTNLEHRLSQHRRGVRHAGRLMQVLHDNGIGFQVAKTMPGTRNDERRLKNRGGASRICPICLGLDAETAETHAATVAA